MQDFVHQQYGLRVYLDSPTSLYCNSSLSTSWWEILEPFKGYYWGVLVGLGGQASFWLLDRIFGGRGRVPVIFRELWQRENWGLLVSITTSTPRPHCFQDTRRWVGLKSVSEKGSKYCSPHDLTKHGLHAKTVKHEYPNLPKSSELRNIP